MSAQPKAEASIVEPVTSGCVSSTVIDFIKSWY